MYHTLFSSEKKKVFQIIGWWGRSTQGYEINSKMDFPNFFIKKSVKADYVDMVSEEMQCNHHLFSSKYGTVWVDSSSLPSPFQYRSPVLGLKQWGEIVEGDLAGAVGAPDDAEAGAQITEEVVQFPLYLIFKDNQDNLVQTSQSQCP